MAMIFSLSRGSFNSNPLEREGPTVQKKAVEIEITLTIASLLACLLAKKKKKKKKKWNRKKMKGKKYLWRFVFFF